MGRKREMKAKLPSILVEPSVFERLGGGGVQGAPLGGGGRPAGGGGLPGVIRGAQGEGAVTQHGDWLEAATWNIGEH